MFLLPLLSLFAVGRAFGGYRPYYPYYYRQPQYYYRQPQCWNCYRGY